MRPRATAGLSADPQTPEEFFAGSPLGLGVLERVRQLVGAGEDVRVTVSRSQVAFRRRRGLAYLWLPGMYLSRPKAEVVLSIVLGRQDGSPRWKEVVHPARAHWVHHLEVRSVTELDDEVVSWLAEAVEHAK